MKYKFESPENIINFIKASPKSTPVKAYINGDLKKLILIILNGMEMKTFIYYLENMPL